MDTSKFQPVPKDDLERFRQAMREKVIKPMLERRTRQAQLVEAVRKRIVF